MPTMQTISAINSVTQSTATGTLSGSGTTNVSDGDLVTIGGTTYRFKNSLAQINDVKIGGSGNSDTSLGNLIYAVSGTGTPGTNYYTGTVENTQVTAGALTSHNITFTATQAGIYGQIATTTTSAVLSWGAATLTGGTTVTIVGTVSQQQVNFTTIPAQRITIPEYPDNPNWSRNHQLVTGGWMAKRAGANTFAIGIDQLGEIAAVCEPSLSWPPLITVQPANATATGNASATGTLTGSGSTNVSDGDTVTIGAQAYRFKTVMAQAFDVQIGGSGNSDTSLLNLIKAINLSGTIGTNYFTGTTANTQVTAATSVTSHAFAVTAITAGLASNSIATTKVSSVLSWGAATLTGGSDNAASFTVTAGVTESTLTYQWQYYNGAAWVNCTGTISGCAYTNGTTATLTCTPTTTGQTGKNHQCLVTNASGTTTTSAATLTIT